MKHLNLRTPSSELSFALAAALLTAASVGCSGANTAGSESSGVSAGGGDGQGGGNAGGSSANNGGSSAETTVAVSVGQSTGTGAQGTCDSGADEDRDLDGITKTGGDCNDCDKNVNANAIEVIVTEADPETGEVPPPADEDCDGTIDNLPTAACDQGIALSSTNAFDGAKAIELCHDAPAQGGYGVVSAAYMRANGTPVANSVQFGIQAGFGPNVPPQGGSSILNLSSGAARLPDQPNACGACDCGSFNEGSTPDGSSFPQTSPECGGGPGTDVYDDIAYEVTLRAPSNATGFAFDFFFYTFEYPDYLCAEVNDQFIAWMQPPPAGVANGNISFDETGNPISVNAAFFQVCNVPAGDNSCSQGGAQMQGTGFDSWSCFADDGEAGGTGWLRTQAPIVGGQEFKIRFAIWDTGDNILDSTVLIDNFQWIASGGTVVVGTTPNPPPN